MKNYSLLLASRDRLILLENLCRSLISTTQNHNNIEVLVGCDHDDSVYKNKQSYLEETFKRINLKLYFRNRSSYLNRDYLNWLFKFSCGKYIIALNDDCEFVNRNWDEISLPVLNSFQGRNKDGVVYGHTETFTGKPNLCYFPLLSRVACDAAGMVMPPERTSWSADYDLHFIYTHHLVNRHLPLPELKIRHISHHNGSRPRDEISRNVERIDALTRSEELCPLKYVYNIQNFIKKNPEFLMKNSNTKILVVYNVCGISNRENHSYYIRSLNTILNQTFKDGDIYVCVSGCMSSQETKNKLLSVFGDKLIYNWIDEVYPLGITFNHSVRKCYESLGKIAATIFVDSGVSFGEDTSVCQKLYDIHKKTNAAMVAARVDIDHGYDFWKIQLKDNEPTVLPIGKTVNLHCQLFSDELYQRYGRKILPDIFANNTSESIFTFMTSAINKRFVVAHNVNLHHALSMDGPSSGFKSGLLYKTSNSIEQIYSEGRNYGFGYEECLNVCMHDPSKFSQEGNCTDARLLPFIKNKCFLTNEEFNYDNVPHSFNLDISTFPIEANIKSPHFTIIMLSHNKPEFCLQAIESLLKQSHKDFQCILTDSGILYDQGYFNFLNGDKRFTIVRSEETEDIKNRLSIAPWCFNNCFRNHLVKGELILYLCDDDIYYENALEVFYNFFKKNPHVHAAYASEDMGFIEPDGVLINCGERIADIKRGRCILSEDLDCIVDYLQFCHKHEVLNWLSVKNQEYFPESKVCDNHSDGIYMSRIGDIVPVYPIDIKVGMNRRTPQSVHLPYRS